MPKLHFGVGHKDIVSSNHRASKCWYSMIERCYSTNLPEVTLRNYADCYVCDDWHKLSVFTEWFEANYVSGWFLDKDLINTESKVYSPETCIFVPRWLNNLLLDSKNTRGDLPIGVSRNHGKYKVRLSKHNKSVYLGMYDCVLSAAEVYVCAKVNYVKECIKHPDTPKQVIPTLERYNKVMMQGVL